VGSLPAINAALHGLRKKDPSYIPEGSRESADPAATANAHHLSFYDHVNPAPTSARRSGERGRVQTIGEQR
jgi:hypothetical protein